MRSTLDQKKTINKKTWSKTLVSPRLVVKWISTWVLVLLSFLCCPIVNVGQKYLLTKKNVALNSPLWESFSYFVLSSLSFADNQHLGVKKNFKMEEGPKDKVILRINLLKSIHVKKMTYQFLCSPSNCTQHQLYNWMKTNFCSYKLSWSNCWIFIPN